MENTMEAPEITIPLYSSPLWQPDPYPRMERGINSAFELAWSRTGSEFCKDGAMNVHGNQVLCWVYGSKSFMELTLLENGKTIDRATLRSEMFHKRSENDHPTMFRTFTGNFDWLELSRSQSIPADHIVVSEIVLRVG